MYDQQFLDKLPRLQWNILIRAPEKVKRQDGKADHIDEKHEQLNAEKPARRKRNRNKQPRKEK